MFKNMKIGMRLGLGFGLVVVLLAAVAAIGINEHASVNEISNRMATTDWTKSVLANDVVDMANDNRACQL